MEVHRQVLERFPGTPWVYGGTWSWYADSPGNGKPVLMVYQYLPLVVLAEPDERLQRAAESLDVRVFLLNRSDTELQQILDSLKSRALQP